MPKPGDMQPIFVHEDVVAAAAAAAAYVAVSMSASPEKAAEMVHAAVLAIKHLSSIATKVHRHQHLESTQCDPNVPLPKGSENYEGSLTPSTCSPASNNCCEFYDIRDSEDMVDAPCGILQSDLGRWAEAQVLVGNFGDSSAYSDVLVKSLFHDDDDDDDDAVVNCPSEASMRCDHRNVMTGICAASNDVASAEVLVREPAMLTRPPEKWRTHVRDISTADKVLANTSFTVDAMSDYIVAALDDAKTSDDMSAMSHDEKPIDMSANDTSKNHLQCRCGHPLEHLPVPSVAGLCCTRCGALRSFNTSVWLNQAIRALYTL